VKVGDLIKYEHHSHLGLYVLMDWKSGDWWATVFHLKSGKKYRELITSFEKVSKNSLTKLPQSDKSIERNKK